MQWREQALAFEQLPGDGAGSDLGVQVVGVADPVDAVRVHAHQGVLDGAKVGVGDGGLVAHAMEVAGPVDRLPGVVTQGVLKGFVLIEEVIGVRMGVQGEKIRGVVPKVYLAELIVLHLGLEEDPASCKGPLQKGSMGFQEQLPENVRLKGMTD